MAVPDEQFLEALRATFKIEAAEHLQEITAGLMELEKNPAPGTGSRLVATVFRAAHSLKGAARAVDFRQIEAACQSLEDLFAACRREDRAPLPGEFDRLHGLVNSVATAVGGATPSPAAAPAAESTVRISTAKLDARLAKAEELLMAKLTTAQQAEELRVLASRCEAWRGEWAKTQPARSHSDQMGEFLARNLDRLRSFEESLFAIARKADRDLLDVGKLVDEILEDSKQELLLPVAALTASFPKLVRDLSHDQGNSAELAVHGEDLTIDKRILEEMKDPLIHLLRNCLAHGIESPEKRFAAGKPARGRIDLTVAATEAGKVELILTDDGGGVGLDQVKAAAVRRGMIAEETARLMGDEEVLRLIFLPEISSAAVTNLAGRGLGLAIVREKVEKLGGVVTVESWPGQGTRFRIVLPGNLTTYRGILISSAGCQFVIPTTQVERVGQARASDIVSIDGRATIEFAGRRVAWIRLADLIELPAVSAGVPDPQPFVLIGGSDDRRLALAVDAVLDEQEIVLRRLAKPLLRVRHIAGATVLGTGRVVPILSPLDLLQTGHRVRGPSETRPAAPAARPSRTVLVAEDSITSRTLLKGILELAGYRVKTAVDGMEAYGFLRTEEFDLLVSDVEMPRLDGFALTARIRADKRLAELPIVLVSALGSREDRERGIDAGANAYIVKSTFDQSDLLETVRRLL